MDTYPTEQLKMSNDHDITMPFLSGTSFQMTTPFSIEHGNIWYQHNQRVLLYTWIYILELNVTSEEFNRLLLAKSKKYFRKI